jgi:hypothetical protein
VDASIADAGEWNPCTGAAVAHAAGRVAIVGAALADDDDTLLALVTWSLTTMNVGPTLMR